MSSNDLVADIREAKGARSQRGTWSQRDERSVTLVRGISSLARVGSKGIQSVLSARGVLKVFLLISPALGPPLLSAMPFHLPTG
jgi:hypothetical protein